MYRGSRVPARVKNREQSERTREALVRAGRHLFAEKGFGGTSTEEIVAAAGVTRGALYHQFEDKTALFLDVFEQVERDLMQHLTDRVSGLKDPVEMLRVSADAFLELCLEKEIRQIALIDAPAVLGWEKWREVDARYGLGLLKMVMQLAAAQKLISEDLVEPLSHLFLGAASEAAMMLAHHPDDSEVGQKIGRSLSLMIDRMMTPESGRSGASS
jgi:AcrR family transcriptional regulator